MKKILRWIVFFAAAAGCAPYEPKVLDPAAELAELGRKGASDPTVKQARPGEGLPSPFDPADGLDEAEVVAVALAMNPSLRAKRLETGESQALLVTAGLWPNPEVEGGWRPGLENASGHAAEASLLFDLSRLRERATRLDIASARAEEVRAGVIAEEWKVVREARLRRLDVLFREQAASLLGEEAAIRERELELTRRRRDAGEGNALDVSVAELDAAETRRDRRRAEAELETARMDLNRVLGLPPDAPLRLSDSGKLPDVEMFDDVTDEELDRRVLSNRFELRLLESAHARSEHELRLASVRRVPGLKLGPSFGTEPEGGNFLGVGVSFELPLFDRNPGEIAEKKNLRERARAAYASALHDLRAGAHEARARLRRVRLEIEAQDRELIPLVRRNQELSEGAFRAREIGALEYATARRNAMKIRLTFLETRVRCQACVIEFEAATGSPLPPRER